MHTKPLGALAALLTCTAALAAEAPQLANADAPAGELRLRWDHFGAQAQGPLAAARRLDASVAPATPDDAVAEALLRTTQRLSLGGQAVSLGGEVLAWQQRNQGSAASPRVAGGLRVNELQASTEQGGWAFSAGKKVVGWDVGFGFRPNDVVQQEARRTLMSTPLEGRPLLQAEHFGADSATTLVWVNPQRLNTAEANSRGAGESALALHTYQHAGAADWHGFARVGAHTAASLGAAVDWVAGDAWSVHGSVRVLQRHDGWATDTTTAGSLQRNNPWSQTTQGRAGQWLVGAQWTGEAQQSLMVEAWHDGTAPRNALWQAWGLHNAGLLASHAPDTARAGNLAWQATPFNGANLRQDNLFVRAAWQPEHWTLSLDALWHPEDHGRIVTASVQWQGDRWRLNAALRSYGGPSDALLAQLPQRRQALLAATWSY
jgi:hypothetical protein